MSNWTLNPIFDSYTLVFATIALLALLLFVGPAFRHITFGQRLTLSLLRLGVLLVLLVAMLRPTLETTQTRTQSATILVLADQSRSLLANDMPGDTTRWEAQRQLLKKLEPIAAKFKENIDVKFYMFDGEAYQVDFTDGKLTLPAEPKGRTTDMGSSLDDVLRKESGRRLVATIMVGDGAQRAFSPRVQVQQAVRELAREGCPLYTVCLGQGTEKSQARDVAIEELQDHYTVFAKNELLLKCSLRARGFKGQRIPVELEVEDPSGKKTVVETLSFQPGENLESIPVEMAYVPNEPGQYQLTVRTPEQPGELDTKNNSLTAYLTVLKGGLKVFYVEGALRPEQKFIRRALASTQDIQVDFFWIDPRNQDAWPLDLEKYFSDREYDVFVIGDVDSRALFDPQKNTKNLEALMKSIDLGQGLLLLGGFHSYGPGGWQHTPMVDAIPVLMDRLERQDFDAPIRDDLHLRGPLPMRPKGEHFMTRLGPKAHNVDIWRGLPPLTGANRFAKLKDNAIVLIQTPGGQPLLVIDNYGLGRVLAFAGDSTWRWWTHGHEKELKRFWRQVVLWAARKDELVRRDTWIDIQRRRLAPDSRVVFTTGIRSSDGDPIENTTFNARVILPDGKSQAVRLSPREENMLGSFNETATPGQYTIEVTVNQGDKVIGSADTRFLVIDQDIELSRPSADPEMMSALAAATKENGGRRVGPDELPGLLEKLRQSPPELEIEFQSLQQLGDRWLDAWIILLLVVVLLGVEWFFRKRWELV